MKGKNLSGKDAFDLGIGGIMSGFGGMMYESEDAHNNRKTGNTEGDGWTVDTCYTPDTGFYETGIECEWINDGSWVIVEEYETKEQSIEGHKKWVKHMETKPKKLWSVQTNEWEK